MCLEYMTSQIMMCENGHSVCSSCISSVSACPTCRRTLINMRNFTLEKVAAAAIYPCINREAGCKEILTAGTRNDHQKVCLYQSRECAFKKLWGVNCPWTGIPSKMKDHVSSEHEYEFTGPAPHVGRRYPRTMFQVPGSMFQVPSSMFQVTLQNVSPGKNYGKAILIDNHLFFLVWEIREDTFYFAVFYAGHEKEATGVTYEFEIYRKALKFAISGVCHSYLEEKREVLTPGECVTIPYGTVQKFVSESKELRCVIKVGKGFWFFPNFPEQKFVAVASDTSCLSDKSC